MGTTVTRKPRTFQSTLRNEVIAVDPNWVQESHNPVEYEFSKNRKFRGNYKTSGAYEPD